MPFKNTTTLSTHDASYNCHKTFYNKSHRTSAHTANKPQNLKAKKLTTTIIMHEPDTLRQLFLSLRLEVLGSREGIVLTVQEKVQNCK
jgi:hypothetical protein